jgi:hypothetical protein
MACSDKFYVGEVGSTLVVNAGLVLTNATDIVLQLLRPDGSRIYRKLSDNDFTIGSTVYTNTVTGETYAAFEHIVFPIDTQSGSPSESILDVDGVWHGQLSYVDSSSTPEVIAPGCIFEFTVLKSL